MVALFGKLPARRDFLAREVPTPVLMKIEPWLQASMAQSRHTLGAAWLDAYLSAPPWRFWFSSGLAGPGLAGVLMPSVDGVGRYFPLTAFAIAPDGQDFALPSLADDRFYGAVEDALLAALDETASLEALLGRLGALPPAPRASAGGRASGTLWWTLGGTDAPPRRAAFPAMPPPEAFADLLRPAPAATGAGPTASRAS